MSGDSFKDLFPANDAEARWVMVLCLARNDIILTAEQIVAANERDDGTNLHWARILAAHLYEAARFVRRGSSVDASNELLSSLPAERRADYRALLDADFLKGKLGYDRNLTFHYPTVDCEDAKHGGPQLVIAMDAQSEGQLDLLVQYNEKGEPKGYRYRFADLVGVEFSMAEFGHSKEEQKAAIGRIRDAAFAFARFADAIFYAWGQRHEMSLGSPVPFPSEKSD